MLSFSVKPGFKTQALQINCDAEGLATLMEALERVRKAVHVHLRGPSGGGSALSDTTPFGETAIGEVIITTGGDSPP